MSINLADYTQEEDEELRLPEIKEDHENALEGGESMGAESGLGAADAGSGIGGEGAGMGDGAAGGQGAAGGMGAGA